MLQHRTDLRKRSITEATVLAVSPSGYYAWLKRTPSRRAERDEMLGERVRRIHEHSRGAYGGPRIHAALKEEGKKVAPKRIARLMKE